MNQQEAWNQVKQILQDVEAETARESLKMFMFSVRPSGMQPGFSNGSSVIAVYKDTGVVESLPGDDDRLYEASTPLNVEHFK